MSLKKKMSKQMLIVDLLDVNITNIQKARERGVKAIKMVFVFSKYFSILGLIES